jgi:thioredoxin reductase (NADPH)
VLDDGAELYAYSVLLSLGISWRGLEAPGCESLTGAGVYYGGATAEAPSFAGQEIFLLGGGNSAGQAALHLARYARSVEMLVFEGDISERMSDYLVHRILRADNIRVRLRSTVSEVNGNGRLQEITIQNVDTGETERRRTDGLFIFIGAEPRTDWLKGVLARDEKGFVLCGARLSGGDPEWPLERDPHLLETSIPGVFVAGDVRADSVKRIGSAVGEGSVAIQFVHQYLAEG